MVPSYQDETFQEDPRYIARLGPGYTAWVHNDLLPSMFSQRQRLPREYARDELLELAWFVVSEYVLDVASRTRSQKDVFPQTRAEQNKVRAYVARMVYNALATRAREEDAWSCVHTPVLKRLRSSAVRAAALQASDFSKAPPPVLDGGDVCTVPAVEMAGLEHLDTQFSAGSSATDPAEVCEWEQSKSLWTEEGLDFADALDEFRQRVMPQQAGPADPYAVQVMPPKEARRDRILLDDGRVNAAYLFVRVFHEKDRSKALQAAPALCSRWVHGVNSPSKLMRLLGSRAGDRDLADIFEDEARQVLAWARRYTRLGPALRGKAADTVVADARKAAQGWRGAYRQDGDQLLVA